MPITIDNIIQSNLELLNEQEDQVLELLNKIRKAKSLFSGNSAPGKTTRRRRRRRPGRRGRPAKIKSTGSSKSAQGKRVTYMSEIIPLLKKNGKMKSGELIKSIARKRGKDYKKIQFSIYPVLTEATKSKMLARTNGFYTLK